MQGQQKIVSNLIGSLLRPPSYVRLIQCKVVCIERSGIQSPRHPLLQRQQALEHRCVKRCGDILESVKPMVMMMQGGDVLVDEG